MHIINIATAIKKISVTESETLSFKTIISQLDFLIKKLLFNKTLEKKRFIVACKQINRRNT